MYYAGELLSAVPTQQLTARLTVNKLDGYKMLFEGNSLTNSYKALFGLIAVECVWNRRENNILSAFAFFSSVPKIKNQVS